MTQKKDSLGFRKTALKPQGNFTPAKKDMRSGVGINPSPKPMPKCVDKSKGTK